jgi:hypothetical protein
MDKAILDAPVTQARKAGVIDPDIVTIFPAITDALTVTDGKVDADAVARSWSGREAEHGPKPVLAVLITAPRAAELRRAVQRAP